MADGAVAASTPAKVTRKRNPAPDKHSLTINFTEPEDVDLYNAMAAGAKHDRRQLGQFALLKLHEFFMTTVGNSALSEDN